MSTADDEPSSALNGRLRPRKLHVPSPQSQKPTRSADGKSAQDKPKSASPSVSTPDDLTSKSELTSTPQFLCPYCEKTFASKQTVSNHVRRKHLSAPKQDSFLSCLFCNHAEPDANIIRHMVDNHPNQYFACLDCHTRFPSTTELAEHKLNICEKQKMAYNSRLRPKVATGTKKNKKLNPDKKDDYSEENKDFNDGHGFNGIVISCELKPSQVHDDADIEDNITTNLILPPCKGLVGNAGLEKNAVIVLDDIQWNKRIPPNFSFHNTDHTADQILSRLGVVHRSPRTGESTRRNWLKSLEDTPQKFEKCFDTSFYSKVASNVQENLAKYLDGSFNFNPDPDNTIKTRKLKNSVAINTAEGFPILLASEQYSRSVLDSYLPRCVAPKHKWKWDNPDGDRNPFNADQLKRDSHVNNCIITLVSSLDIWTQLSMRRKFEDKFRSVPIERKIEKRNTLDKELKEILESREIPSPSQVVLYISKPAPNNRSDFPASLGLAPSAPAPNLQPAVLSGEWVRPRCYVCCACGAQTRDPRALSSHNSNQHPNSQVQHYEIVGEPLLNADIMKHLYVPPKQMGNRTRPPRGIKDCTKCGKPISLEELHQHMLDCAGDTPTVRRRTCRYRPFGVRKRRARLPDNTIRKKIRKDIRTSQGRQKKHMRSRPKIRSEVGDAETIRKMLADLPAKRHRVMVNPVNMISRPRRKLEQQRSKMMLKKRPPQNTRARKAFSAHGSDNASQSASTNSEDPTKNTFHNDDDEDNKPLRPRIKRVIHKLTMHNDPLKRQNLFNERKSNRSKRKPIRMKQQKEAEEPSDSAASPSGSGPTINELSIDDNSRRIDVKRGPYNTREQANRGGGNNREDQRPDSSRSNENADNQYAPAQNAPLKHSIASLTSNSETQDKAVQFHHLFLVQQECNDVNQHVPSGRQTLFENEAIVTKLDKPPLLYSQRAQADYYALQKNSKLNKPRKGLNDCIAMLKNKLVEPEPELATGHVSVQCGSDEPIGPLITSQITTGLGGMINVSPRRSFDFPQIVLPPTTQYAGAGSEFEIYLKQNDTAKKQHSPYTTSTQHSPISTEKQSPISDGKEQSPIAAGKEHSPISTKQQSPVPTGTQQSPISGGKGQRPMPDKQPSPSSGQQPSPSSAQQQSPNRGKRGKRRSNSNTVPEPVIPAKVYQTRGARKSQRRSAAQIEYDRAQKRSLQYGPDLGINPQQSLEYLYERAHRKSIEELSEIAIALQKPTDYQLYERALRKSTERNLEIRISPRKSIECQYGEGIGQGKMLETSPELRISPRKSAEYHPYYEIPQPKGIDRSPVFGLSPQKSVEYPYQKHSQKNVIPEVRVTAPQHGYHYNDIRKHMQISPEIAISQQKPVDYLYCQIAPINPVSHYPDMQISPQRPVPYQYCELPHRKSVGQSADMQISPHRYINTQYREQTHPQIQRGPEIEINSHKFEEQQYREMMQNRSVEMVPDIGNGQQKPTEGRYVSPSPSTQKPQKIKSSRSSSQKSRTNSETDVQRFSDLYPTNDAFLLKPVLPSEVDAGWRDNYRPLQKEGSVHEPKLPEASSNAQTNVYPEMNVDYQPQVPQPNIHPERETQLPREAFSSNVPIDIPTAHTGGRLASELESAPLDLSKTTAINDSEKLPRRDYETYNYNAYETLDLVKNSSDEDALIDVENDVVVDLSVKPAQPGYEPESLDLCMKSQDDNVPTDLSFKRSEKTLNESNPTAQIEPVANLVRNTTTYTELEQHNLTQSDNVVAPTYLSNKSDKTVVPIVPGRENKNDEITKNTAGPLIRENSQIPNVFTEQLPAPAYYEKRNVVEREEPQHTSEITDCRKDNNDCQTPVMNVMAIPPKLDSVENAASSTNVGSKKEAATLCNNVQSGNKPAITPSLETSNINHNLEDAAPVHVQANASIPVSKEESLKPTAKNTGVPETITRHTPPPSMTDSVDGTKTIEELETSASHKHSQLEKEKDIKNTEPTLDNDPETAKKIALLPKELVDILGNMPVDHRNQLLNILPQYVSTPTVSSSSQSSSVQTITNATSQIATSASNKTAVVKTTTTFQTENTPSSPLPATSPDQPNTQLDYDKTHSNDVTVSSPMSVVVNVHSNQEDKSTSPQISPTPGNETVTTGIQERLIYTVFASNKPASDFKPAPLIDLTYDLSNNEAKPVSSELCRSVIIPPQSQTNILENEKSQTQKKTNDQTASLRAVRIKAPSERHKDSQIIKRSLIEQPTKPNTNDTDVSDSITEKSLAIQQAEVSSTEHHNKNYENEAKLMPDSYTADYELNGNTQQLSTSTPEALIDPMPENKNDQIDGLAESKLPNSSVVTSSISSLKNDPRDLPDETVNESSMKENNLLDPEWDDIPPPKAHVSQNLDIETAKKGAKHDSLNDQLSKTEFVEDSDDDISLAVIVEQKRNQKKISQCVNIVEKSVSRMNETNESGKKKKKGKKHKKERKYEKLADELLRETEIGLVNPTVTYSSNDTSETLNIQEKHSMKETVNLKSTEKLKQKNESDTENDNDALCVTSIKNKEKDNDAICVTSIKNKEKDNNAICVTSIKNKEKDNDAICVTSIKNKEKDNNAICVTSIKNKEKDNDAICVTSIKNKEKDTDAISVTSIKNKEKDNDAICVTSIKNKEKDFEPPCEETESVKTLKHGVNLDPTSVEISAIDSNEVITKKIRLSEAPDPMNSPKSSNLDRIESDDHCDISSSHVKNNKKLKTKSKLKKKKKRQSQNPDRIKSMGAGDTNLINPRKTNSVKDNGKDEICEEKPNKMVDRPEHNISPISEYKIDEQAKPSPTTNPVPEPLEHNSESSTTMELDTENTSKPLRRSRRGKSLFVYNDFSDHSKTMESEIDQKTPFTKKQLIFSKLLHDEEINAKPSVDEGVLKEICNKDNSDNTLSSDAKTSEYLPEVEETVSTSECSIENKSTKRKKSPHAKRQSKKKKSSTRADCTEKLKTTNSENYDTNKQTSKSVLSTEAGSVSKDTKKTKHTVTTSPDEKQSEPLTKEDDSSPVMQDSNIDKHGDKSVEITEKRKSSSDLNNDECQCSKAKKIKFNKTFEDPVEENAVRSNQTRESESEVISKSSTRPAEYRPMCYNMPVASRRTRSKSVVEKTSNTDLYDPYNIDLDEMYEKTEPFRATGFLSKCKVNNKANKSKLTESKPSSKQESVIEVTTSGKAFKVGDVKTHSKKNRCETIVSGEYASIERKSKKEAIDESIYKDLGTVNDIFSDSAKGNMSDSDDSTRSDVPLNKYVLEKQKKMAKMNNCLDSEHTDYGESSTANRKNEELRKKRRNLTVCKNVSTVTILNEADEQLRSEQFMESFGFFSQRKPRKSNLLASKKIAATFHVIANDNDDMYFGPNQRITRRNPQSGSSTRRSTRRGRKKKNQDKTLSCLCRTCQKLFRRPDNLMRHQMTLLHVSRMSELDLKFKTNCVPEEPNYLCAFKHYLDRLKKIAVRMGKYKKNPKFKLKMPSVKDIIENVQKGIVDQRVTSRNLSRDEALFLDCCELLKESHRNNVPTMATFLPNHIFCIPKALGAVRKEVEEMFKTDKPGEPKTDGEVDSVTAKKILESEEVRNLEQDLISVFQSARPGTFGSIDDNYQPSQDEGLPVASASSAFDRNSRKSSRDEDSGETVQSGNNKAKKYPEVKEKMYPDVEEFDMFEDKFDKIKRKSRSQAAAAKRAEPAIDTSVRQARKKSDTKKGKKRTKKKSPSAVLTKGALKGFDSLKVSIPTSDINMSALTHAPESPPKKKKKAASKKKRNKGADTDRARGHVDEPQHRSSPKKDVYEFRDNEDVELFEFRPSTVMERFKLIGNKELERLKNMSHRDIERAKNTANRELDGYKGLHAKETDKFKALGSKKTETYTSKNYPQSNIFENSPDREYTFGNTNDREADKFKMISRELPSTSKAHLDFDYGDIDEDSSQSASDGDDFVYMSDHSDDVCSDDETESTLSSDVGKLDLKKNTSPLKRKDAIEKNVVMGKIFKHNAVRAEKRVVKVDEPAKPNIDQLFDSLLDDEKPSTSASHHRPDSPDYNDSSVEDDETPKYGPLSVNVYDSATTKKNLYTSPKKSFTVSPNRYEPTPSTSYARRYRLESPDRLEMSMNRHKIPSPDKYVDPYEFGPSTSKKPDPIIDLAYPSTSKQHDLTLPKDTKYSSPKKHESAPWRSNHLPAFDGPSTSKATSGGGRDKSRMRELEMNDCDVDSDKELALDEDAGVARQRARRKCTVGKQNVLAESWSSESEPDGAPPRPGSAQSDSSGAGRRKRGKRKDGQAGGRRGKSAAAKKVEETRVSSNSGAAQSSAAVSSEVKEVRAPTPPGAFLAPAPVAGGPPVQGPVGPDGKGRSVAYYWSSEGDEEQEHLQQHGWIVGDSHKKLVTMLAHAKGRKRNNDDKCHSE